MKLQAVKYLFVTFLLLSNIMAPKIVLVFGMILPAAVIALLDTPFCYMLVRFYERDARNNPQ